MAGTCRGGGGGGQKEIWVIVAAGNKQGMGRVTRLPAR